MLEGFVGIGEVLRSGVYALMQHRQVVYIGKSKCMLGRIYTHRNLWSNSRRGQKTPRWLPIQGVQFDDVMIRPCPLHLLDELEAELIAKYRPRHNIKLKPEGTTIVYGRSVIGIERRA